MIFSFCSNMVGKVAGSMVKAMSISLVIMACAACCSCELGSCTMRCISGMGANPCSAAHQVSRRS